MELTPDNPHIVISLDNGDVLIPFDFWTRFKRIVDNGLERAKKDPRKDEISAYHLSLHEITGVKIDPYIHPLNSHI